MSVGNQWSDSKRDSQGRVGAMSYRDCGTLDRDRFRANLLKFTRKAYEMLPQMNGPRILDIGCGTGVVTIELARLSGGSIVGVDIDELALDKLRLMARKHNLSGKVSAIHQSMLEMEFPPGGFDVIWTEGAISFIGFERGLKEWRDLVTPDGHLVVHDVLTEYQKKIELTRTCGYIIVGRVELSQETWWNEYYAPLKRRLEELQARNPGDKRVNKEVRTAGRELKEFDLESDRFASVFLVLKKT
jgi:cyclopropane fatty-acyl-phospholipid synthase-like methyltransferase